MEQLVCYPAEAGTWESEIFPARLHPYDPSWLDTLMQEGELLWIGSVGHRVTFCFESELDLLGGESGETERTSDGKDPDQRIFQAEAGPPLDLFPDTAGRYDFSTLLRLSKWGSAELAKRLWDQVWRGRVTKFNVGPDDPSLPDYLASLRHLLTRKFQPAKRVSIETINGEKATGSLYLPVLRAFSDIAVDYKYVTLYRRMW